MQSITLFKDYRHAQASATTRRIFLGMVTAAALLFFMSAILSDPFKKIAQLVNDRNVQTSMHDWMLILKVSVPSGLIWSALWLWFKGCEKKVLEIYFSKAN